MQKLAQRLDWHTVRKVKKRAITLTAVALCLISFVRAQAPVPQQDDPPSSSLSRQLSDLQMEPARQAEIERAIHARDYAAAEKILLEEVARDPKSPRSAKLLTIAAGVFFLDGQYANAVIAWKKAEAIAPLDDRSQFTLAMAYVKLNRRDWARSELEKLAVAQPPNPLFLYWLARLDYDERNYNSAVARLQKVIALDPKMARAYDTLGLCFDYLGKFDEAVKNYNQAVDLNRLSLKPSPWPHVDLAISLIALNQLPDAEKNLREAIGYDSRLPQAHYQLGRVLEMQGGYQAAVESLKLAVALAPQYPEPHYLLGRIYHRVGNEPLSRSEIARFQELRKASEAQAASGSPPPPM
jgi:tetratricopeptide (TPR) repeat protein